VGSHPLCKLQKGCTRLAAASDEVYQLLSHGRWFSPASSTTKTGRHDIAEILLKVALKHQTNQSINQSEKHRNRNTQMAIHFPALTQALQLQIAELRKGRRYRRGNY
jgi:hypothetical protein